MPMSAPKRLSVVIVTWNVRELVLGCLESLYADLAALPFHSDVWVVDNASQDGTAEAVRARFPQTKLLEPGKNLGFAAGNNLALRQIGFPDGVDLPDYVFLLNPDTLVRPGAVAALIGGLEQTQAGLAGARLVYGDGAFQHSAFRFPGLLQLVFDLFPFPARVYESRLNGRYPRALYDSGQPFPVDHPLGATFLLRREVITETGLFDERFWLYCEEIDWAMRIRAAGWQVVCVPAAEVVHLAGQSTGQIRPDALRRLWEARLRLYHKHYPPLKRALALWLVRLGMNRMIQRIARDSTLAEDQRQALVQACWDVIRASRRGHI